MKLEFAAKTDVGRKRDHNEDAYGVIAEKNLFFVCDGMGGHTAGDYASQKVVETVTHLIGQSESGDVKKCVLKEMEKVPYSARLLSSMVMLANRRLFRLAVIISSTPPMPFGTALLGFIKQPPKPHAMTKIPVYTSGTPPPPAPQAQRSASRRR